MRVTAMKAVAAWTREGPTDTPYNEKKQAIFSGKTDSLDDTRAIGSANNGIGPSNIRYDPSDMSTPGTSFRASM